MEKSFLIGVVPMGEHHVRIEKSVFSPQVLHLGLTVVGWKVPWFLERD